MFLGGSLRRYSRVELGDALEKKLGLNWRICWGQIRVGYFRAEFQSDKETKVVKSIYNCMKPLKHETTCQEF